MSYSNNRILIVFFIVGLFLFSSVASIIGKNVIIDKSLNMIEEKTVIKLIPVQEKMELYQYFNSKEYKRNHSNIYPEDYEIYDDSILGHNLYDLYSRCLDTHHGFDELETYYRQKLNDEILKDKSVEPRNPSPKPDFSKGKTIYVNDDAVPPFDGTIEHPFKYIQDGINASTDGDTVFVYNGNYFEHNITIDKSITLTGENRNLTIIDGGGDKYCIYISANWVNIAEFTIQNAGVAGIGVSRNNNNLIISKNYIEDNDIGLACHGSLNLISENLFINNIYCGIWLQNSYENNITNNIISDNNIGMRLEDVINSSFYNNTIIRNVNGIWFHFLGINNSIFNNNIMNNYNGVALWDDSNNNYIFRNNIANNDGYGIKLYTQCNNNTIEENNIFNNSDNGISFIWSSYNTIQQNIIRNCGKYGIFLWQNSTNNYIMENTIYKCDYSGITIEASSNYNNVSYNIMFENNLSTIDILSSSNNMILNNQISNNYDFGIVTLESNNNIIIKNEITSNKADGINCLDSFDNIIQRNNISNNGQNGIWFSSSNNNLIVNNMIMQNHYGIYMASSNNNDFYENNFLSNTKNAGFYNCKNSWKDNYWARPRLLPYLIFGQIILFNHTIPWLNFDWHPALKRYEI